MISGIREPNSGKIKFKNSHHRLGEIAYMQQKDLLLPWLNVEENILLPLKIMGKITTESIEDMKNKASILGIYEYLRYFPKELSGGLRQRVSFLRTILQDSDFILLDEPFAGVDPIAVEEIQSIVNSLKQRNIGVLITDHNVRETLSITDRSYLLFNGKILKSGSSEFLANDEEAKRIYLGEKFKLD